MKATQLAEVDATMRAAELQASIAHDALPAVDALVQAAQQRVDLALQTEARRLEAEARRDFEVATENVEAAERRRKTAADAMQRATHFVSAATNRRAWGNRAPAFAVQGAEDDIYSPSGWAKFTAEMIQRNVSAISHVTRRVAQADAMLAEVSAKKRAGADGR